MARRGGLKNAGLRAVVAAAEVQRARRLASQDPEANEIAMRVYGYAVDIKAMGPSPVPLAISAPLTAAAELAAVAVLRREGLPETDDKNVKDVAGYLVAVFREAVATLDADQLARLRRSVPGLYEGGEPDDDGRDTAARPSAGPSERGPDREGGTQADGQGGGAGGA